MSGPTEQHGSYRTHLGHGPPLGAIATQLRDEVLYGRDPDHARVFVSSKMNGTLNDERRTAVEVINTISNHRAWWWEDDAPMGVLHSEHECTAFAQTSDGLVLLVAGALSKIVYAEYFAARHGGAERYIFIRSGEQLPDDVQQFIDQQRGEAVTRNFQNLDELRTHLRNALGRSLVRALRIQLLDRRSQVGGIDV